MKTYINLKTSIACIILSAFFLITSCKKDKNITTYQFLPVDSKIILVLNDLSDLEYAIVSDFDTKVQALSNAIITLVATPTASNLTTAQNAWKQSRNPWECNEGFAFGPVSTLGIDAASDDWPADQTGINAVVTSTVPLNDSLINTLATPSKGFHAIEYLLFGATGIKTLSAFTTREFMMLNALTYNLKQQSALLKTVWTKGTASFADDFINAGNGSKLYTNANDALSEVLNALVDITNELPNTKIQNPLQATNNNLAESPYSNYSLTDYQNNILSVKAAYVGVYSTTTKQGLSVLVENKNSVLNDRIITQINLCIALGNNFNNPFSVLISTSQTQLVNWQTELNKLNKLLDTDLRSALGL